MKKYGTIIKVETPKNLTKFITDSLGEYKITPSNVNLLIERVGNNLSILNQEIIKLKNYKDDDYNITEDDILEVTSKNIQPDMYYFIDCIVNRNLDKALELYNELLIFNEEPIAIIALLANKFRMMYQSKYYFKKVIRLMIFLLL